MMNHWFVFLMGALVLSTGDTTPTGLVPARIEMTRAPDVFAANPAQLAQCIAACGAGGEKLRRFCRSLRDVKLRAACWALEFGGEVACKNWCYWHFSE